MPRRICFIATLVCLMPLAACDTLTGASISRGPDLTVTAVTVSHGSGDAYTVAAVIANQGNGRAIPSHAQLSIDNAKEKDRWTVQSSLQRIGMLAPGNTVKISWSNVGAEHTFTWTPSAGKHRARVCADAEGAGALVETNESNNCKVVEFTVR